MNDTTAKLRYVRISPRKIRLVANLVRGLPVGEARAQLILSPRRPSVHVLELLKSCIANAENNHKLNPDGLFVKTIQVDKAPTLKRWMPRSRGSMNRIEKKASHLTITLGISDKMNPAGYDFSEGDKQERTRKRLVKKVGKSRRASEREHAKEEGKRKSDNSDEIQKPKWGERPWARRFFRRKSV